MYRITPFLIYIAVFTLTWPAHFAVKGIPKTRKELCLERGYKVACTYNENHNPCQVLKCGYFHLAAMTLNELVLINGVPDYTECGESKICMNAECVHAHGPMPHYRSEVRYAHCQQLQRGLDEHVRTRREQCKSYGFDVACEADDGLASLDCDVLKCGYEGRSGFYYRRSACKLPIPLVPDSGTWCGDNRVCWNKVCIPMIWWPTSEQRPTYGRPEVFDICCPEIEN